jgi:hypothetical protein
MIPVLPPAGGGVRSAGLGPWALRLPGFFLLFVALTGLVGWLVTLSPFQLERWRAVETSHYVTFPEAGTYTVFEEGDGAATRRGDARVIPTVRSIAGRQIPFRSLLDPAGRSPQTYDVRVHQGRAIGAIDIDRPGRYVIVTFSAAPLDPDERDRFRRSSDQIGVALGPEGEPSPWGTWGGLALLAGLPALAGVAILVAARAVKPLPLGPVLRPRAGGV